MSIQTHMLTMLLTATLIIGLPTGGAGEPPTHRWECGAEVPPSGPYLDRSEGILYDYSCITETLTPMQMNQNEDCTWAGTVVEPAPIAGVCALIKKDSIDTYTARFRIAEIGTDEEVFWKISNFFENEVLDSGTDSAIRLGTVVFWDFEKTKSTPCEDFDGSSITVGSQINWPDGSGSWYGPHNTVNQC